MEDKFGPFIPIDKQRIGMHTKERYGRKPLDPRLEKHAAWQSYKRRKRGNWRGFLEEMSPLNAEAREALEIQSNYLSIFFGGDLKRSKPRDIQPRKGRPNGRLALGKETRNDQHKQSAERNSPCSQRQQGGLFRIGRATIKIWCSMCSSSSNETSRHQLMPCCF